MTAYDFGPKHPLRPERLERTVTLLSRLAPGIEVVDPGLATRKDVLRVHTSEFIEVVAMASSGMRVPHGLLAECGFVNSDNPPFPGMYEAALAYCGGAVRAAEVVRDGAGLAFSMAGGLHHARRGQASGFCVFNDCALACSVLRERFGRIAYVDIDLHHGDGVQWIFWDDPTVLTASIHESGHYLYPGTGFVEEHGDHYSHVNVPLDPHSTGDTWLWAFERGILAALEKFRPEAIVLQMGADPHFLDPLGHLDVSAQEWLEAVRRIRSLGLPIVALGGGGYEMTTVPRMWVSAVLTLMGMDYPNEVPDDLAQAWNMPVMADPELPEPRWRCRERTSAVLDQLRESVLARVGS